MQNEKTLEQMIREYEANMPPEILTLIKSFDWKKEVRMIVNQNQLMIDTGADLEQSVYLMILGAVKVDDLYERLMDVHEIPQDKAQKIIQEMENQIFNPLHKKLMELEEKDTQEEPVSLVMGEKQSNTMEQEVMSRDDILAEIEKESAPIVKPLNPPANTIPVNKMPEDKGVTKPFTLASTKEIDVQEPMLSAGKVVEGVQQDPVSAGLKSSTVTQPQPVQTPVAPRANDPYRESIE